MVRDSPCETGDVPQSVRARLALIALVGVFLIPIVSSSLNGLTHVLTCQQSTRAPFTLEVPAQGPPTISSSATLVRGRSSQLCGGLLLDITVQAIAAGKVRVALPITNQTRYQWRGSVKLVIGHTSIPVSIGTVGAGSRREGHVDLRVDPGSHEIAGSLLIGP
jgi:hypothetical protein